MTTNRDLADQFLPLPTMTREALIEVIDEVYQKLTLSYSAAYALGILGEYDKLQIRGALYNLNSIRASLRREMEECEQVSKEQV